MPMDEDQDRRDFLKGCGGFAAVTPPAMTFLLSTTLSSKAIASSHTSSGPPSRAGQDFQSWLADMIPRRGPPSSPPGQSNPKKPDK
jgi:hypothetical protein